MPRRENPTNGRPPKEILVFDRDAYLQALAAKTLFRATKKVFKKGSPVWGKLEEIFNDKNSQVWDEVKLESGKNSSEQIAQKINNFFNHRSSLYTKKGRPVQLQGEAALISRLCS